MGNRDELRLFVTIHGPHGEYLSPGDPLPRTWTDEYVDTLLADGAAGVPSETQLEHWGSEAAIRASFEVEANIVQTGVRG